MEIKYHATVECDISIDDSSCERNSLEYFRRVAEAIINQIRTGEREIRIKSHFEFIPKKEVTCNHPEGK